MNELVNTSILTTKLYIPQPARNTVLRPRLIERLNAGSCKKLTLISAPAGSGKTTLVTEWLAEHSDLASCSRAIAWLSLDDGDHDPVRFFTYLFEALKSIGANIGDGMYRLLDTSPNPPVKPIVTAVIQATTSLESPFFLVLDDYHLVNSEMIDDAVALLIERMPPRMHLIITTRTDPHFPLARWRVRNLLTEIRAADLRFTSDETADFLNQVMGLNCNREQADQLETRTEGWIAGIQLAALSLQGHQDPERFIRTFGGGHRDVLDYLVEEVLKRQPEHIQRFLLVTSILDRMCASLCDALFRDISNSSPDPSPESQVILEYMEHANLFIIPLDHDRQWFRYHHLFAEMLRKRLYEERDSHRRNEAFAPQRLGDDEATVSLDRKRTAADLHIRASAWYEDHGLEIEAFRHAVSAQDLARAVRIVKGKGVPLIFRGAYVQVLEWLTALSESQLNAHPELWVLYASALLIKGQTKDIEEKLHAAELVLQSKDQNDADNRDLIGHIASIRAAVAVISHQIDTIASESRKALEYAHADNLPVRAASAWTLGYAYQLQGDIEAAGASYYKAWSTSVQIGHIVIAVMSGTGMGNIQEDEGNLNEAAKTYRQVLEVAGDPPIPAACEAHLGLARIHYEWNELQNAANHVHRSIQLARQLEQTDRAVAGELMLARLQMAIGEMNEAVVLLDHAEQTAKRHQYLRMLPDIADQRVTALIAQGNLLVAARVANTYDLPFAKARIYLAQGNASAALKILRSLADQVEMKNTARERLKLKITHAMANEQIGDKREAVRIMADLLAASQAQGWVRTFIDEGPAMARFLREAAAQGIMPEYARKLLLEFPTGDDEGEQVPQVTQIDVQLDEQLIESLSSRELEILQLIAQGLSNQEISDRLYITLSTVKGHNQAIFGKLQVKRRTEAVARARKLGLL